MNCPDPILTLGTELAHRLFAAPGGYQLRADDLWIIATAIAGCVTCGVLGCFLVLRRMSLLGDAISHAILPGLALAFLLSHSRDTVPMLVGAMGVGLVTAFLSSAIHRWGRVPEDAAMGVVFTSLFALGVLLITWVARDVDLDPGCVLYGLIEFVPFDTVRVLGLELPRAFAGLAAMLLASTILVSVFYKELKIVCFDPALATTLGISATLVHYGLMATIAATAVASFEAVGSILVVAMLVAPGATAHLLTDRLSRMLFLSAVVATLAAVLGYVLAVWVNTSVAGMIASVALGQFILAVFIAPRHGYLPKQYRRIALTLRIAREDTLGILYRWHEQTDLIRTARPLFTRDIAAATHSGPLARLAVGLLRREGLIHAAADGSLRATDPGLRAAATVVRGHRLWESYLAKHLRLAPDHLHEPAHRAEHFLSLAAQAELAQESPEPQDPHGRPIPPAP